MKRKNLNPVCIVLNRNFNEVSESMMFAVVIKTEKSITMNLIGGAKEVCEVILQTNKEAEVSVYVKQPFTSSFVPAKRVIDAAMKRFFPEVAADTSIETEEVDEVTTETSEVVEVVEAAPKKSRKKKEVAAEKLEEVAE